MVGLSNLCNSDWLLLLKYCSLFGLVVFYWGFNWWTNHRLKNYLFWLSYGATSLADASKEQGWMWRPIGLRAQGEFGKVSALVATGVRRRPQCLGGSWSEAETSVPWWQLEWGGDLSALVATGVRRRPQCLGGNWSEVETHLLEGQAVVKARTGWWEWVDIEAKRGWNLNV